MSPAPPADRISVVLPVYDEHDNIAACLRGLWEALEGHEHEILVVYDYDEDTTLAAIAAMSERPPSVRLVKNELGRGAANALRAGFAAARGEVVVTTMADLSDPPEKIPALAEKVRAGAAVVAGSRYAPGGSQQGGPLLKRTLSRWAGLSLRWIAGLGTHDATSNFRAYSKRFLDSVVIESTSGFQIALELTVKAHLAGLAVDEVPSSWTDRSAGQSRFRLWRWLPGYMRWWLRAALAPACTGALLVGLVAWHWTASTAPTRERPLLAGALALAALGAGGALAATRALRGRNGALDLLHPLLWLHPWLSSLAGAGALAATLGASLGASLALLAAQVGPRRLGRALARLAGRGDERLLGLGLVWLLLWTKQLALPAPTAEPLLDPSWEQALGRALLDGLVWGRDIVFTFGPLGWLFGTRYEPDLWWLDLVWWQGVHKAVLAGFLVAAFTRVPGAFGRVLFLLALLLPQRHVEVELFQGVLACALWILLTPRRPVALTALALLALSAASLVKFTVFLVASPCMLVACLVEARRRSLAAGAALGAGFLLAQAALWSACGQPLSAFPGWLRSSLWIAGGYGEAMSATGPGGELAYGLALALALSVVLTLECLRPPRSLARLGLLAILLWTLYVASKSGFVRHLRNPLLFHANAALLPLLVLPQAGGLGARLLEAGRYLCVLAALHGYALVAWPGHFHLPTIALSSLQNQLQVLQTLATPARVEAELRAAREETRASNRLPRVVEAVGERSIDLWHSRQAWLFLNDLRWHPRPVFQSYVAYTPELSEANRAFYDGPRAPDFVLWQSESIDGRVPNSEDAPALLVLLRDYEPVLLERDCVLFARRAEAPGAPLRRTIFLERELRVGEVVELELPRDGFYELTLDLRHSLLGAMLVPLTKAPELELAVARRSGARHSFRIVPAMARTGVLVEPLLFGNEDWVRWLGGTDAPESDSLARLRLDVGERLAAWYRPTYRLRIMRIEGLAPARSRRFAESAAFASFPTPPDAVRCAATPTAKRFPGLEAVLLPAPSELVFELSAQARRASGAFGLDPSAWREGESDGARFVVALQGSDGREELVLERWLDPRAREEDRALQRFELPLDGRAGSRLVLRVDPGPRGEATDDQAFWALVEIGTR